MRRSRGTRRNNNEFRINDRESEKLIKYIASQEIRIN